MILSKHFHYIEIDDNTFAIFNNLIFKPLFVDRTTLSNIQNECFEVLQNDLPLLKQNGIIVEDIHVDEDAEKALIDFVHSHTGKLGILYLIVTTQCNLACKYCFIDNNPFSSKHVSSMDSSTAKKAIDLFLQNVANKDDAQIIIYGGEPLVNAEVVEESIKYIREQSQEIKLTLITNATLLSDKTIGVIKSNDVGVGVSIDGPKGINDRFRVFKSKDGSVYDHVSDALHRLKANQCKYSLSITITKDVLEKKDEVLAWILSNGYTNVFWNLYHFSSYDPNWDKYYEKMAAFIFESYDLFEQHKVHEGRVEELLTLFANDSFRFEGCGAIGINQIAILPSGNITICHGDSRDSRKYVGNINNDSLSSVMASSTAAEWKGMYTVDHPECLSCEALFVCGGGCPAQAEVLFGNRHNIDKASCIFYKKYVKWVLNKYYSKGGRKQ